MIPSAIVEAGRGGGRHGGNGCHVTSEDDDADVAPNSDEYGGKRRDFPPKVISFSTLPNNIARSTY